MTDITEAGRREIAALAGRYNLSEGAVESMARAVANGGGTMAQFNIPELGGGGQWMAGGMTMVGDMFNSGLQATVSGLCADLSEAQSRVVFFAAPAGGGGAGWWPAELGQPAAVGGQNQLRYAYFPAARRVAVDRGDGGPAWLFDTLDHQIGGFSQQQSGGGGDLLAGVTFSSQYGMAALASLPRVDAAASAGAAAPANSAPPVSSSPASPPEASSPPPPSAPNDAAPETPTAEASGPIASGDILATIERMAALRDAGALTEEEFAAKKRELLARL